MGKLIYFIQITETKELLFFYSGMLFCFLPWNVSMSQVRQINFWHTRAYIPRRNSIFVDTRIFVTFTHILFHWMVLHNTNQPQQHSCGHGYIEHIQLQIGWASKALCIFSAEPANDTFRTWGVLWQTAPFQTNASGCLHSFHAALLKMTGQKHRTNWTATS